MAYADAQAIQHAVRSLGAARTKGKLRSARERAACAGSMLLWIYMLGKVGSPNGLRGAARKYRWSDVRGCIRAGERQAIERCVCEVWYVYAGWPVGARRRRPGAGRLEAASSQRAFTRMSCGPQSCSSSCNSLVQVRAFNFASTQTSWNTHTLLEQTHKVDFGTV